MTSWKMQHMTCPYKVDRWLHLMRTAVRCWWKGPELYSSKHYSANDISLTDLYWTVISYKSPLHASIIREWCTTRTQPKKMRIHKYVLHTFLPLSFPSTTDPWSSVSPHFPSVLAMHRRCVSYIWNL